MVRKYLVSIMTLLLVSAGLVWAGRLQHDTKKVAAEDAKKVSVKGDFGAGEIVISGEDIAEAAIVDIFYDEEKVDYDVEYDVSRSTGRLVLASHSRRRSNIDTEDNRWEIVLSTRYPVALDLEVGACDADFELGGIPLEEVTLEIGASSGSISFSKVNPVRLVDLDIEAGASSLKMNSVGNANFEEFNFSGGVGSFDLDLSGEYHGESVVNIEVGLGSADIVIPEEIPVRIETDGSNWLSSVEIHHDDLEEVDDDAYESPGFEKARDRIVLKVDVGMGSIDIYFE
ncbi:MAG: toast rack family protein [candidate division Zixibacteria bacterium]|nr:toast rack family protein [candidate division Zixibacteria bacterium]